MSLLMNEEFSIYQLRLGYLNQIRDGVGERLITLNPAVLNDPAFRTAGWTPDVAAIKRCYSPPIPTGTSGIRNEYFQAPRRPTMARTDDEDGVEGGMEGGGMVTGHQGSEDTLGPVGLHANERKRERRRRKEQLEEDDSSDLSDDSEEEERTQAQSIKFSKMPVRNRAASSPPARGSNLKSEVDQEGPAVMVTSPSRPQVSAFQRFRRGSAGGVDLVKQRARRDTTTSSEMSSENELPPDAFRRKLPSRPGKGPSVLIMEENIQEEDREERGPDNSDLEDEDDDIDVGEASDLSDEFEGTAESPSLLGIAATGASDGISSPPRKPPADMPPAITASNTSPKKLLRDNLVRIPKLAPEQRPRSVAQPVSMISMMLRGDSAVTPLKPFQQFADLSGKDEANPFWFKISFLTSDKASKVMEVPLRRTKDDRPVMVAEVVGYALWLWCEEERTPALVGDDLNFNRWTLRILDDGEIDDDFPPLGRLRHVTDFAMNNKRPPQRRMREKSWDEFGLERASDEQCKENEAVTPNIEEAGSGKPSKVSTPQLEPLKVPSQTMTADAPPSAASPAMPYFNPAHNPITGPSFAQNAIRKDSNAVLDLPQREGRQAAPKTGAKRTITVQYTNPQSFITRSSNIETTTDSYIAEVFEQSCKNFGLDRALHALRVHGMQNFAPTDRTVEALGDNLQLDLVPRLPRNIFGMEFSGSPGSTPPNAPLDLTPANATPKKKTRAAFPLHPLAAQQKAEMNVASSSFLNLSTVASRLGGEGRRYNVLRKQPLSFAGTHPRTLIITPDYMTIMPAAPDSLARPTGKVTNVPMTSVIGAKVSRKHPKMVRILVFREKETKRYDFEAFNHQEAEEIVAEVRRGMEAFSAGVEFL